MAVNPEYEIENRGGESSLGGEKKKNIFFIIPFVLGIVQTDPSLL